MVVWIYSVLKKGKYKLSRTIVKPVNVFVLVFNIFSFMMVSNLITGWERSGRVLDSGPRGCAFEPLCCVLEHGLFILALYWLNPGRCIPT